MDLDWIWIWTWAWQLALHQGLQLDQRVAVENCVGSRDLGTTLISAKSPGLFTQIIDPAITDFMIKNLLLDMYIWNFWLRQELKESLCVSVCLSVCAGQVCQKHSIFISLTGISQASLRSLSGLSQVCLRSLSAVSLSALLAYFIAQTEPKILRLVKQRMRWDQFMLLHYVRIIYSSYIFNL